MPFRIVQNDIYRLPEGDGSATMQASFTIKMIFEL
jgi:hypothetical protein